jgi:hypothetical protein
MNYQKKTAYQIIAPLFLVLQIFTNGFARDATFEVDLTRGAALVRIKGSFTEESEVTNRKNLAFLNSIGGANELGKRILEVRLFDRTGRPVEVKRFADGEYVAARDYHAWEYTIDLTPSRNNSAAAHISWVNAENGILMTDDLLPQFIANARSASADVTLKPPTDWKSFSAESNSPNSGVHIDEISKGIIFVGKSFREKSVKSNVDLMISGTWHFTDDEASQMAGEIFQEYTRIFGAAPAKPVRIAIMKFPGTMNHGVWEAETRGRNVTLLSSDMPFRTQSLQRLHEQLRHEIFHLWIPNGVRLKGNYAWFYEGFALYQSLKTAVAMNRIRFDDFLDTLSRAYSIDIRQSPRRPLINSENRSSGVADTQVYARGMLIAFLLDVAMLRESKGRANISQVSRQIFQRHSSENGVEGNAAALEAIDRQVFAKRYILGADPFEMDEELAGSGIVLETTGRSSVLRMTPKPSGREKEILDRLGYNNWRKSSDNLNK